MAESVKKDEKKVTTKIDVTKMNIFQKCAAITAELPVIPKSKEIEVSAKNKYKVVTEADVLTAIKPLEEKYRVYSYPSDRSIVSEELRVRKTEYGEKTETFVRLATKYVFVNIDNPEDKLHVVSYGDGIDPGDKAPGKAMTYADKTALLKAYHMVSGDDADNDPSGNYVKTSTKPPIASAGDIKSLKQLIKDTATVEKDFLKFYGISKIEEFPASKVDEAFDVLSKKIPKEEA
jgi:hypothetical protein